MGHGEQDNIIPLKESQESMKPIENFNGLCKYIYPNLGHSFCSQEITDLKNFLIKSINGN